MQHSTWHIFIFSISKVPGSSRGQISVTLGQSLFDLSRFELPKVVVSYNLELESIFSRMGANTSPEIIRQGFSV